MSLKPFKRPSFKSSGNLEEKHSTFANPPPSKRRKLSPEIEDDHRTQSFDSVHIPGQPPSTLTRKPLNIVHNLPSPNKESDVAEGGTKVYYSIVFRKVTAKKNKTWEDDGVMLYKNGLVTAYTSKGHKIGSAVRDKLPQVDDLLSFSGKDIQVEGEISYNDFCLAVGIDNGTTKIKNVVIHHGHSPQKISVSIPTKTVKATSSMTLQEQMRQQIQKTKSSSKKPSLPESSSMAKSMNSAFKQPMRDSQFHPDVYTSNPIPRHDPDALNALIFKRPEKAPPGKQIVDVVLDPILTKHLRDHQRTGVQFLYECVMGLRDFGGQGCVLADDMGLGKTLQTIALIWTLVKQNPIYNVDPVIKKVLIVCPVSLVQNWKREFRKWLGRDRLGVMSYGDQGSRLSMFDGKNFNVMIVGYERLQKIAEDLTRGAGIDLIVCDEGHRLKSLQNKSTKAIETLNTTRRIILSGTPIQNDLTEFFAMVNFVNDGILGSAKAFARDFEKPIIKSRQPKATADDIEKGKDASDELQQTTAAFILRRTADILSEYLPVKTEYVLFCRPTPEQANLYRNVLQTPMFKAAVGSNEGALQMITILKKLCNSPNLLRPKHGSDESTPSTSLQTLNEMMPKGLSRFYHNSYASKIRLLDELLHEIRATTSDKVVLVSNYTATLDLMQNLLDHSGLSHRRLDGTVPPGKRQSLVDEFNRATASSCFAFLLSAKAGGQGINLIGGNRLVLFDVDWNPATDDQAMARIHRQGQKKPCHIYRFLIKGGLEERIWQRQVVKRGLADSIMESGGNSEGKTAKAIKGKAAFSIEELKDLFRLDESEGLRTHDLIGCGCLSMNNTPANTSSYNTPEPQIDDIDEIRSEDDNDDDDDESIRTFSFTRASQVTSELIEEQERSISTGSSPRKSPKKRPKDLEEEYQELMTYTHVNTSMVSSMKGTDDGHTQARLDEIADVLDDPCLLHVVKQERDVISGGITHVFLKRSKAGGVEKGVDILEEGDGPLNTREGRT